MLVRSTNQAVTADMALWGSVGLSENMGKFMRRRFWWLENGRGQNAPADPTFVQFRSCSVIPFLLFYVAYDFVAQPPTGKSGLVGNSKIGVCMTSVDTNAMLSCQIYMKAGG